MKLKWMRALAMALIFGTLGAVAVAMPQEAEAAPSSSGFDPGYIISDSQFYVKDAMSQDQIQAFLDSNIGTCLNSLCLNVLRVDTPTTTLAFGTCATYPGEANESAARIIYKVQQACSISAKVLLVTLQKEQGLVTSRSPSASILRKALGQGCPDTAACDSAFYGFFNQMYSGARQLTWYGNPQGSHTSIKVGQLNAVRFHPNAACGSSNVVVQNRATAALYYYTPYQPNAAALANMGGTGDACSSYGNRNFWVYYNNWFGSPTSGGNPIGNVESVRGAIGGVTVSGWALDPDAKKSIEVHVYVDGVGTSVVANASRPDVGAAYPTYGNDHGYSLTVPVTFSGTHSVCVYGINIFGGSNTLYGCSNVVAQGGSPIGGVEAKAGVEGGIALSGWAIDPDTIAPMGVHVYVDGVGAAYTADKLRTDVGAAYPGYGNNHGFSELIAATAGIRNVCVYGINTGSGVNADFGCSMVTVPGATGITERGRTPIGVLEAVSPVTGGINVAGWALDPDTAGSIAVHVYVDGVGVAYSANRARSDVGAAFPGYGNNHGFAETVVAAPGSRQVCVYAINTGPGAHPALGCSTVTVPGAATNPGAAGITERGRVPLGVLEAVAPVTGGINVAGWALDPDTAESIAVHVYVDGVGVAYQANRVRSDVGGAFPGYGDNHGFAETVAATAGTHQVCVYAINSGPGNNAALDCSAVTVL